MQRRTQQLMAMHWKKTTPCERMTGPGSLLVVCAFLAVGTVSAQLTVTPQSNLQQLAAAITGPGVTISNPVITCHSLGYGEYSYSGSGMAITEGVILTTGRIDDAPGPNNSTGSGTWFAQNTPGDPLLDAVTGRSTRDACKFEFDIIPTGDSLRFEFTFGSEEYNEWVGSQFNDVFGFFISGPGINGDPGAGNDHNIALIPGTSTAVTINNVNNGSNSAFYHDNTGGSETQYDGCTVSLAAEAVVNPCNTYHLKLIVADASDRKFDSGVFIERIQSPTINLSTYTLSGAPDMVEACNPGWIRFDRGDPRPTPLTLQYYLQGTATNGTDYTAIGNVNPTVAKSITIPANAAYVDRPVNPLFDNLTEPDEYIRCILGNPNCPSVPLDTVLFYITDSIFTTLSPGGTICAGDSLQFTVTGGANYSWTPAAGLSCTNCPNPWAHPANTTTYSVTVTDGSCVRTMSRQIRVSHLALDATVTHPLCNGDQNGAINLIPSGGVAPYAYVWTGPDGFTASTQDITNLQAGTYTVTVHDAACTRTQSWNVIDPAPLSASLSPAILPFGQNIACYGGSTGSINGIISGGTGPYTVSWTGPGGFTSANPNISGLIAGSYTIAITDAHGCSTTASTALSESPAISFTASTTANVLCYGANIGAASSSVSGGIPPYAYSWNSSPAQTTANAGGLSPGNYAVTLTDSYGCTATANATIGGPIASLSTNLIAQTNVLCSGNSTGAASISISGGTAPYTTSWNTVPAQNGTSANNLPAGIWTATVTDANGCSTTRDVTITQPASALSASLFTQTNVLCFGNSTGSATVSASGGTGPYTYQWNSTPAQNTATASNLPAGSYSCIVRDVNLCATTVNVTITQPAAVLNANISAQTNVLCFANSTGSVTVNVSGGTGPYSYNWNSSPAQSTATASNLPAGTFTCTITDANGCTITRNATITQPTAAMSAIISAQTNVLCFGNNTGSATVSVTGGTGTYSYSWNTTPVQTSATATGLAVGTYTCTITDANGCSVQQSVTITEPAAGLSAGISGQTNVLCFGNSTGTATVNASGGTAPYGYLWNSSPAQNTATANNLPAGSFVCTITDSHGCTTAANVTIAQPASVLSASLASQTNVLCFGNSTGNATVNAGGGTGAITYQWNTSPAQNTATATGLPAGTYTCTVRDANLCTTTVNVTITQPTAVLGANITAQTNVLCFGNSTGSATASATGGTSGYSYSWNSSPVQATATASNLPAGIYSCTISDANGCTTTVNATITQPASSLSASLGAQTNVTCFGNSTGSATVNASGGTGTISYSWNTTPVQTTATATGLTAGSYTCTVKDASNCTVIVNATITQPAAALDANITAQTNVLCFGNATGSATVSVSGGTPAYTYSWNTTPAQTGATANNLPAGTWTCTITDANSCSITRSATITQPAAALSASISAQTNVLCFGNSTGSATANSSGGAGGYSYTWNTTPVQNTATASNLPAGTYTCTIGDANGCGTSVNVTITQPASALNASLAAQTNVSCVGAATGSATVNAIGGSGLISYLWNTSPAQSGATAIGLTAGSYTCTVHDANNCAVLVNVIITQPAAALSGTISAQTDVLCVGNSTGSATASANGGTAAYAYSWNTSPVQNTATAINLPAGTWTCTITDANGCSTAASATIAQPAAAIAITGTVTSATCGGAANGAVDATVTGGTGAYGYAWTGPSGFSASSQDISAIGSGVYTLTVTDANGCSSTNNFNVGQPGLFSVSGVASSFIGGWNVSCAGGNNGSIDMTVSGGTTPYMHAWTGPNGYTSAALDITGLQVGDYTYVLTDANGCSVSASFTLTAPTSVLFTTNSAQEITCNGDANAAINVTGSGGTAPIGYSWSGPGSFSSTASSISGLQPGTYTLVVSDANGCTDGGLNTWQFNDPAILVPDASMTSGAACFGDANGSATTNVTGGIAPYSITWNTVPVQTGANATGLAAGTYTATVTDARGCVRTQDVTITQPAAQLSASITAQTNVLIFGQNTGSATVTPSGGTPAFSYSWSNGQTTATATGLAAGDYTAIITDANGCTASASVTITQPGSALSASISAQTNVLCFGNSTGNATVSAIGGTSPYTYAWNTAPVQNGATASNLTAGNYVCTVTDANGAATTVSATITQPVAPLNASTAAQVNAGCFGDNSGSATVNVSGGTPAYSYSWNTLPAQTSATATGLVAGNYTCTITDAHGCGTSASAAIMQPTAALNVSIGGQNDVLCFGNSTGSATANAIGGTTPYSFAWSNGQSTATAAGLAAGDHTCTVTDANGCTAIATATIAQPTVPLNASIASSTDVSCSGGNDGTAAMNVTGGTVGYSYSWNTTPVQNGVIATDLSAGTWTCTITDVNGCGTTSSAVINEPAMALNASIIAQTNVACSGNTGNATVGVNGGTAPYSLNWNTAPVQTTATATGLGAGTYTCTVTDANGCSAGTNVTITAPAGALTASLTAQTDVDCFGNATGSATVSASMGTAPYSYSWNTSPAQNNAAATGLAAGNYTCTVTDANACTTTVNTTIGQPAAALNASIGGTSPATCGINNGSASTIVSGGTAPYGYAWSSLPVQTTASLTGAGAGTYAVTVSDAQGCSTTASATITSPSGLATAVVNTTSQTCFGTANGQATVAASGGSAPYSIIWNTSPAQAGATASGLIAGSYTATVTDADGCNATVSVTIDGPVSPLALSIDYATDVTCFNATTGSATVSTTGGLAPYAIVWNTLPAQVGTTITGVGAGTWTATATDAFGCSGSVTVTIHQPNAPVDGFVDASQNVSCFGGNDGYATIEATGGSGDYSIEWNTTPVQSGATATGLTAGFWFATILDNNGCSVPKQVPVTISGPASPLAISSTTSDFNGFGISCASAADGSIAINTIGGTMNYSFAWTGPNGFSANSEDLNNLQAGSYDLLVTDANGCTQSVSADLAAPAALNATASITTAACNGASDGAVDLSPSGGVAPYAFAWTGPGGFTSPSEDISNVGAGVYGVTTSDANGCSSNFLFNVSEPSDLIANATLSGYSGGTNVSCATSSDGAIDATISGGTMPYSYQWDGPSGFSASVEDISGLAAGTYDLTITDANGCGTLVEYTLTAPTVLFTTLLPATYPSGGNVSCDGAVDGAIDATITGGTPNYGISWSGPNGFVANTEDISALAPGTYTVTISDANGCPTSQSVTLDSPSQLNTSLNVSQYNSGDAISCTGSSTGIIDLSISGGLPPYSVNWNGPGGFTSTAIDISGLAAGTYTAVVNDAAGCDTTFTVTLSEPPPIVVSGVASDLNGFGIGCNGSTDGSIDLSASGGAGNFIFLWTGPNAFISNNEDVSGLGAGIYDVIVNDMNGCKALLTFNLEAPTAIAATAAITSATCQGTDNGAIDLSINGGVAPYATQWNGPGGFNATTEDLTGLFAGIYDVTITDANGCTANQSFNVNEPGLFTITATSTVYPGGYGVSCNGSSDGAIDVTASGGTAPLFFAWQGPNGFTAITEDINALAAGLYNLTLTDANGCSHLTSWTVTSPTPINIGLSPSQFPDGSNVACSNGGDGSIDATIIGGVAPYSISWSGPDGPLGISEDLTGLTSGTYTVSVVDAIGCSATASITLTEPTPISLGTTASFFISGGNVSCNGQSDGSIDLSISGGSLLYFIHWTGPNGYVSNNEDISGLEAGNYNVTVMDANGCSTNTSVTLIAPNPILIDLSAAQYSGGYAIACNGTTGDVDAYVQGGAVPWTYAWTGPNGFTSSAQDLIDVPAGTYDLLVTDAAGCTATASITMTEPTPIDATATVSAVGNGYEVGCAGNDGSIDLSVSGGNGPYTIDWSGTGGFASLNEDLSGLSAGIYDVTITDVNSCASQMSFTLEQAAAITTTTVITGNMCDGLDDGAIDLGISGGVAPYGSVWNGSGGFTSMNEDINGLGAGTYTVDITDANGCTTQQSATITASAPIDLSVFVSDYGDVNIPCSGANTGVIEATISGGAGSLDILWSGPNGFSSTDAMLNGLVAGDYTLSISDINGCSLDTTISLIEPDSSIGASMSAAIQPSGSNVSCFSGNDGSIDLSVSGGVSPYDITWHGPAGTSYSTEDPTGLAAGHYDVVISDVNGCSFTDSIDLTGPDSALMASIDISQYNGGFNTSCDGNSDGYITVGLAGGSGAYQLSWSGPGGFSSSADSIGGLQEGIYTLTVTDMNGCALTEEVNIVAPDPITWELVAASFPSGTNISCHGMNDGSISASLSGGSGTYEATWTGPDGYSASSLDLADLYAGEYCINIMDGNGCAASDCITLGEPETLDVSTTSTPAGCGQSNGSIDASISGGTAPYSYAWSNGAFTEDISGLPANDYRIIVTDANGCTDSTMALVGGGGSLSGEAIVGDALCHGDLNGSIDLSVTSGSAPYTFVWTGGANSEDLSGLQAGSYQVHVTDASGCTWSDLFTIHEPDAISAESTVLTHDNGFNVSAPGAHDGGIAVDVTGGTAPYTYLWSSGATSSTVGGLPVGTYSVTITDANGCTRTLEFTLTGPNGVELPTGFTPNGDGQNDLFVIHGLENHPENQLLVFNRWGNVVYDRLNYKNDWGGENREGEYLPNGTYFIILRLGSDATNLQGYVDLRR